MSTARPVEHKAARRSKARSRALRVNPTETEVRLWRRLSARQVGGTRFNRQFPIGPLVCDFVSRAAGLVVEVDGGQHRANAEADAKRAVFLKDHGYQVIRFWNNDVLENTDGAVEAIAAVLRDRPSPSPSRGREGR